MLSHVEECARERSRFRPPIILYFRIVVAKQEKTSYRGMVLFETSSLRAPFLERFQLRFKGTRKETIKLTGVLNTLELAKKEDIALMGGARPVHLEVSLTTPRGTKRATFTQTTAGTEVRGRRRVQTTRSVGRVLVVTVAKRTRRAR